MKSKDISTLQTEVEVLWDGYQYIKIDPPPNLPPSPQPLPAAWIWFAAQVHIMQTFELF